MPSLLLRAVAGQSLRRIAARTRPCAVFSGIGLLSKGRDTVGVTCLSLGQRRYPVAATVVADGLSNGGPLIWLRLSRLAFAVPRGYR